MSMVLVTGGSGFVGSHVILQLLTAGHQVRTTVRTLDREAGVRAMLEAGGMEPGDRLSFVAADLGSDAGWAEAVAGCDYVMHVASPMYAVRDENELIGPAREGTLRVLRAARDAGVKRIVITSSAGAIAYGHPPRETPFDETDWTNIESVESYGYIKSKTLAERAAWDFIANEGNGLELAVINPAGIFGPVLSSDLSGSVTIIQKMLSGSLPALPRVYFGIVDVRDVADLHVRAMTDPAAKGERFIAVAGPSYSLRQVAEVLQARLGKAAARVSRRTMPDRVMRVMALFNLEARAVLPQLGVVRTTTSAKARRLLGWTPRATEDAIVATAESLLQFGVVKQR